MESEAIPKMMTAGRFDCVVSEDVSAMLLLMMDFAIDIQHIIVLLLMKGERIISSARGNLTVR